MTISETLARELLDLGARLRRPGEAGDPPQAKEQLRGAVAIHNILQREGVAYLADEVGMGKTYVALGAIALFRHFDPGFRVAVIAPRENIQTKWMKEWFNFATNIVQVRDLRVKALHGGPARPLVKCENLLQFIRETTVDPERDFFLRLSSFSLGSGDEESDLREVRTKFKRELPWIEEAISSLHSKREFKDSLAKALCCALPDFDLLVVDEAHNLKHGFAERIAARNRVLAFMFGRPSHEVDRRVFRHYGPRAKRVLFLSATPIEDDYRQLWNQLDVFGQGEPFVHLRETATPEDQKRTLAKRFLIRRVTSLEVGNERLTKNLYRREWRRGGVTEHDDPISIDDIRQRLVVALVQKKVSELLNSAKFGASFQMGMLASFESFLETVKLKRSDEEAANFDDSEQTDDEAEREGIDVKTINGLASDYRRRFNGQELPHPKMDALVSHLSSSWEQGQKALVFLRRVASVWEVKERLDQAYNRWLADRLRKAFAESPDLLAEFNEVYQEYSTARAETRRERLAVRMGAAPVGREGEQDRGGDDTFFAWFFRGEGPQGWLSGAKFSQRFGEARYEVSTFYEDNYAAELLGVSPGEVLEACAAATGLTGEEPSETLTERAAWYLTQAKRPGRREMFEAVQGGAIELLRDGAVDDDLRTRASAVWQLRFQPRRQTVRGNAAVSLKALEYATFFTALRRSEWAPLRDKLWPIPRQSDFAEAFHEQELRRELASRVARLGHSLIDLYAVAMLQRGTLRARQGDDEAGDDGAVETPLAVRFLESLDNQRAIRSTWAAFDELEAVAQHFDLILDVNEPALRSAALGEVGRIFGSLLGQQQPVGGMTGQVNKTLVRQFRMPGYPFVLLSTDLLQEGEDLHTFCSHVYHYGLAWTPSAVEQRIGRIDRVRSKTERTAGSLRSGLPDEHRLQVFYPHLEDTVERLQVRRVLRRMHEFIRLMHEGLSGGPQDSSKLNVAHEIVGAVDVPTPVATPLETSFPVDARDLVGRRRVLAVTPELSAGHVGRLMALRREKRLGDMDVVWANPLDDHGLSGTVTLATGRFQPFTVHLHSFGERLVVRCVSTVGRLDDTEIFERASELSRRIPEQLGIVEEEDDRGADLTVEEEVLLGDPTHDLVRVEWLVLRVIAAADRMEQGLWNDRDETLESLSASLQREGRVTSHVDRTR